jgi:hypothetical protein
MVSKKRRVFGRFQKKGGARVLKISGPRYLCVFYFLIYLIIYKINLKLLIIIHDLRRLN